MTEIEEVKNPFWENIDAAMNRLYGCKFTGEYDSKNELIKVQYISRSVTSFYKLTDLMWNIRDSGKDSIIGGFYE